MKNIRMGAIVLAGLLIVGCGVTKKNKSEDMLTLSEILVDESMPPPPPLQSTTTTEQDAELHQEEIIFTSPTIVDASGVNDDKSTDISDMRELKVVANNDEAVVALGYSTKRKQTTDHQVMVSQPHIAAHPGSVANEEYSGFRENKFLSAMEQPLSTFSVDVDAASYSNMRRFVNQGQLPPNDAIRIEEMINYFSYNYTQPKGSDPVNILTEVGACPWNGKHRLVRIGIKAREIDSKELPSSNFVFLVDVSGSMSGGNRIGLVKSSLKLLLNNLREKDRVSIVAYAGSAQLLLPPTSGADKQKIRETINNLQAGGSTNGSGGMKLAYEVARQNFNAKGNNRIIMCSDGDFNVGYQSEGELEKLVEAERKSGIYLSLLGYGMGNYKDNKMQILAQKGNGNHAYIDNLQEANKVLVNEFGSTMYAVAKDVKLQLEFNPTKVQAYRLVGYETRLLRKEDFNNDAIDAGEMGAGHTVTAFYEVIPVGVKSNLVDSTDPLKYQSVETPMNAPVNASPDLLTVKLRYKQPNENVSKLMQQPLIDNNGNNVSEDFRFAASVVMFGQTLKNSDYKGTGSYDGAIRLAQSALNNDKYGYKREFVRLIETTKGLATDYLSRK